MTPIAAADLTNRPYWKLANAILKVTGLREGSQWRSTGYLRADVGIVRPNVVIDLHFVKVRPAGSGQWTDVDLTEANFL